MKVVSKRLLKTLSSVGHYTLFMIRAFSTTREALAHGRIVSKQMVQVGVSSLPVVLMASCFAGIVVTLQTAYQLDNTILTDEAVGSVVVPTLMLEMAALIPGLVLASRVGASIAAELGTMKVTEQIDALEAMGMNSVAYLVLPRVAAGLVMFPSMYVASALVSIVAGGLAGGFMGYLSFESYILGARTFFLPFDPVYGMAKSMAFGFLITSIASWKGFHTQGGAHGVGTATTQAVVVSCVNILIADYILAELLL
ncbi:MAG: ABC transporter permease [Bacteroidetes Order II. Incertae sedis bacterium]|nr:ABC transporter permease [Bacteroidetes Order II. bacterium]